MSQFTKAAIGRLGITKLYTHQVSKLLVDLVFEFLLSVCFLQLSFQILSGLDIQAQAVNSVRNGRNIVVATSTASGKSLCYNVPVLEELTHNPTACALYLFPTKVQYFRWSVSTLTDMVSACSYIILKLIMAE